jgi:hypothetical protein
MTLEKIFSEFRCMLGSLPGFNPKFCFVKEPTSNGRNETQNTPRNAIRHEKTNTHKEHPTRNTNTDTKWKATPTLESKPHEKHGNGQHPNKQQLARKFFFS